MQLKKLTVDDNRETVTESVNAALVHVESMTTGLDKAKADTEAALKRSEEAADKAAQALSLAQQLGTDVPGRGQFRLDGSALVELALEHKPDEDFSKSAGGPVDRSHFSLMQFTKAELAERGVPADTQAVLAQARRLNDAIMVQARVRAIKDPAGFVHGGGVKGLRLWKQFEEVAGRLRAAISEDGGATSGGNWIPTFWSGNLRELIQVQLRLGAAMPKYPMQGEIEKVEVEGDDMIAYYIGENTTITDSDFTTPICTLTARKLAAANKSSREWNDDNSVRGTSHIAYKSAKALRRGWEQWMVNGQRTVAFDTGLSLGLTDARKAGDGIRYAYTLTGGTPSDAGSGLTADHFSKLQGWMGAYGIDPSQCIILCSTWGNAHIMSMKSGSGANAVQTLNELGPKAVILNGQLGSVLGMPILPSEFVSNEHDANGIYTGTGDRTTIYIVNRDAFLWGERLGITLEVSSQAAFLADTMTFKAVARGDFQSVFTPSSTNRVVGAIGNLVTS